MRVFQTIQKNANCVYERDDVVFQINQDYAKLRNFEYSPLENKTIWAFVTNQSDLVVPIQAVIKVKPMNSVLRPYLTAKTGQGASRITYCAVEPNTNFPTFDLLLTPIITSSISFSSAIRTRSSPGDS